MNTIIDTFITNLINKTDINKVPDNIDLIISGGAFNGIYAIGITKYLKQFEKLNKLKINRISGASVGSVIGFAYLLDKLDMFNELSNEIIYLFKKNSNLYDFRKKMYCILDTMDENDYLKLNNKLYITYFDTIKKKQKVIKKYKNNKHVINTIIKSCYIPLLMNNKLSYKGKIDGGYPYIFKRTMTMNKNDNTDNTKKTKTMYINLLSFKYFKNMFYLKNETNSDLRILKGILDVDRFITFNKSTDLCSYMDDWNIIDYLLYHLTVYCMFISLLLLDGLKYITRIIPNNILKNNYYLLFKSITFNMYNDIFSKLMN